MNIEQTLSEYTADEMNRLLLNDFVVTTALKELLHHATGCEIPLSDDVTTSEIEEMIPLCLSILRRFWNIPLTALGDGTEKKNLADIFQKVIGDRVQGNEVWSIPAIHGDIPTVVSALERRHIDDGLTLADGTTTMPLPDGISLAQVLCGKGDHLSKVVEIIDDNIGWTMTTNLPTNITGSLTKLRLGCAYVLNWASDAYLPTTLTEIEFPELISWGVTEEYLPLFIYNNPNITELTFPKCKAIGVGYSYDEPNHGSFISTCSNLKKVSFPELVKFGQGLDSSLVESAYGSLFHSCESLEEVYMPKWTGYRNWRIVRNVPNLRKLVLGTITSGVPELYNSTAYPFDSCVNLVHLEIAGCVVSLDLRSWSPTTALSERLPEFLYNFQTYIADRVADMTGKTALTLTLSSEVYAALEAQEGRTILATLANKKWDVAQA